MCLPCPSSGKLRPLLGMGLHDVGLSEMEAVVNGGIVVGRLDDRSSRPAETQWLC